MYVTLQVVQEIIYMCIQGKGENYDKYGKMLKTGESRKRYTKIIFKKLKTIL